MNDNAIIKAIRKIHFTIVSFIVFALISSIILFISLQKGVAFAHLRLPYITIEQLYIKWNEKLALDAGRIIITKRNTNADAPFDSDAFTHALKGAKYLNGWFEHIHIHRLTYGDAEAALRYDTPGEGTFALNAPDGNVSGRFSLSQHALDAQLEQVNLKTLPLSDAATLTLDLDQGTAQLYFPMVLKGCEGLTLEATAGRDRADFTLRAPDPLSDLGPLVSLFGLPDYISRWIVERAAGTGVTLYEAAGSIAYAAPAAVVQNLRASARFENLAYTFNPDLPPVLSAYTDLAFEEGVLSIFPTHASYEGQSTGKSWLNIDFNPADPMLNAYFDADLQLDEAMLKLLKRYRISLPFLQTEGTTRADLALHLNLTTESAAAKGRFSAETAEYSFKDTPFQARDLVITLDNALVGIERLELAYGDELLADVTGTIDAGKDAGSLAILARKIRFAGFELNATQRPLSLHYNINATGDRVHVAPSQWRYGDWPIRLGAIDAPFDFNALQTTLPATALSVEGVLNGQISGRVDAATPELDLLLALDSFRYDTLALDQRAAAIKITYRDMLRADLSADTRWRLDALPVMLQPLHVSANSETLYFRSEGVDINGSLQSLLYGDYRFNERNGTLTFETLRLRNKRTALLQSESPILAHYRRDGTELFVSLPQLGLKIKSDRDHAQADFNDLGRIAAYSPLMRDFNLSNGTLQIAADLNASQYRFSGQTDFPYPLLVNADGPVTHYAFNGIYRDDTLRLKIGDAVIKVNETVKISAEKVGFNLGEILRFINDHATVEVATPAQLPRIHMLATESFIYLTPERRALAERIELSSDENGMTIGMQNENGIATFDMNPDLDFHLYGHGFNDRFMNALLPLSTFKNGQLAFIMSGHVSKFSGVIQIKKTIMKDYKLLNNVLAFINTVPSLITFRLPDYNSRGLNTKEIYTAFVYEQGDITLDAAYLNAKEMDIFGKGKMNIMENRIDVTMTLKSDIGSQLSKIPVVGYIILGEDGSVSTTLDVTGKLDDPNVKNALAKDIINAPLNIIKRTLMTPFRIFEKTKE